MSHLFFDFETRGEQDISVGYDNYFPEAEPTVLSWALDEGPVHVWEIGMPKPERFLNLCYNPEILLTAHHVAFDRSVLAHCWGVKLPIERFHCTMAQAYAHNLPGALEALGPVLGLPTEQQKLHDGRKLVLLFCKRAKNGEFPDRKSHPEEWARFVEYAHRDTEALREVFRRLPTHNYTGVHKDLWHLDTRINERGVPIDMALARAAVKLTEKVKRRLDDEVSELTNGVITAATQRDRVLTQLVGRDGLMLVDMSAGSLRKALEDEEMDEGTRRLIELRLESSVSSTSKYKRMLKLAGPDGRIRWTMQYAGADRTGRWAGRGVQPHNLPRPSLDNPDFINDALVPAIKDGSLLKPEGELIFGAPNRACADALRATICATPGHKLVAGDWSNIEGRVLAALANEEWKLEAYRDADAGIGADVYKVGYGKLFHKPVDAVTKFERTLGKVIDLACGFAGSVGAFVSMAAIYEIDLDSLVDQVPHSGVAWESAQRAYEWALANERDYGLSADTWKACRVLVQAYRDGHPATVEFWNALWDALVAATENPGQLFRVGLLKVWRQAVYLIVELPSGRRLLYARPQVKRDEDGRPSLSYMAAIKKQWRRKGSWRGLPVENVVQAVANDILREALPRVDAEMPVVFHVHDEIVTEVPVDGPGPDRLCELMVVQPEWMPELPLAAAGYEAQRYRKD
jgi:DNA polymerase